MTKTIDKKIARVVSDQEFNTCEHEPICVVDPASGLRKAMNRLAIEMDFNSLARIYGQGTTNKE